MLKANPGFLIEVEVVANYSQNFEYQDQEWNYLISLKE
jgi:hypothetical protein